MQGFIFLLGLALIFSSSKLVATLDDHENGDDDKVLLKIDFTDVGPDGEPTGWDDWRHHKGRILTEGDITFLRIEQGRPGRSQTIQRNLEIPEGTERLRVSARVRGTNLVVGDAGHQNPRVQLTLLDAEGERIRFVPSPRLTQDSDWTDIHETFDIPDNASTLAIRVGFIESSGTFDIDTLRVEAP